MNSTRCKRNFLHWTIYCDSDCHLRDANIISRTDSLRWVTVLATLCSLMPTEGCWHFRQTKYDSAEKQPLDFAQTLSLHGQLPLPTVPHLVFVPFWIETDRANANFFRVLPANSVKHDTVAWETCRFQPVVQTPHCFRATPSNHCLHSASSASQMPLYFVPPRASTDRRQIATATARQRWNAISDVTSNATQFPMATSYCAKLHSYNEQASYNKNGDMQLLAAVDFGVFGKVSPD